MLHFARAAIFALAYQTSPLNSDEISNKTRTIEDDTRAFLKLLDQENDSKKFQLDSNTFFVHLAQGGSGEEEDVLPRKKIKLGIP